VLTTVVGDPALTGRQQRVLILVDLATAELHSGNLAAACSHAARAAELLHQAAYTVGTTRLRTCRTAVHTDPTPASDTPTASWT
jgi:hypothetical protein